MNENEPLATQPGMKTKTVKDYSKGSLRDKIANAATLEELEMYRNVVLFLDSTGELPARSLRKLEKMGAARYQELQERLVRPVVPELILPKHLERGGKLIVEP